MVGMGEDGTQYIGGEKDKKKIIKWIKQGELGESTYIERGKASALRLGS